MRNRFPLHAVTGAFGYSGQYIAHRLLQRNEHVITLTNSPRRASPLQGKIQARPLGFSDTKALTESLRGVKVLYNTYWVRFDHLEFGHSQAVENTEALFAAAVEAGVERIVHVSITNPSLASPLPYFAGKARLEEVLRRSGLSYCILRPAVLFGPEDILINNIAWALRKFPIFGIFGDGSYRLQPIHVDDLASLAVERGRNSENVIINATGPEDFSYRELVEVIGRALGRKRKLVGLPPEAGYLLGKIIGVWMQDVFITREEIRGLMQNLLHVDSAPTGTTRLSEWAIQNAGSLGLSYAGELSRRRDREMSYGSGPQLPADPR